MEANRPGQNARQRAELAQKRALCHACRVRQECLEEALADPDLMGIWAGTTERERFADTY